MSVDVEGHLAAVERSVASFERDGRPACSVTLGRGFPVPLEDLWDAVTNSERIPQWFLPVTGELTLGGRYQLQGNAGGVVTACEPPSRYAVTWEFAADTSWVEVRCSSNGASAARLELAHTMLHSPNWDQYGPGATGVGWELGLLGLALHLERPAEPKLDEEELAASREGKALIEGSAHAWGEAGIASGEAPHPARTAARRTAAFYTGQPA